MEEEDFTFGATNWETLLTTHLGNDPVDPREDKGGQEETGGDRRGQEMGEGGRGQKTVREDGKGHKETGGDRVSPQAVESVVAGP